MRVSDYDIRCRPETGNLKSKNTKFSVKTRKPQTRNMLSSLGTSSSWTRIPVVGSAMHRKTSQVVQGVWGLGYRHDDHTLMHLPTFRRNSQAHETRHTCHPCSLECPFLKLCIHAVESCNLYRHSSRAEPELLLTLALVFKRTQAAPKSESLTLSRRPQILNSTEGFSSWIQILGTQFRRAPCTPLSGSLTQEGRVYRTSDTDSKPSTLAT